MKASGIVIADTKRARGEAVKKSELDISSLNDLTVEAKRAALDSTTGPSDPTNYNELRGSLEACRDKLPPAYRDAVYKPFVDKLDQLGNDGFNDILLRDPNKQDLAGMMMDISQAILQHCEGFSKKSTDGFQEVASDLYDGFLSAEDRKGIKIPDNKEILPPLVKWGNPDSGPYTWPVDATSSFGLTVGIVNLPPANATHGLVAWSALGHETAGHDIIHADDGLAPEMANAVKIALQNGDVGDVLPGYWADRIDETASDVCGILNMGPAAGIGLIAYFRALNAAYTKKPKLRNTGPLEDPHPADVLRGYLAASVVRLLSFDGAEDWANVIEAETDKDVVTIRVGWDVVEPSVAKKSAEIVAATLVRGKMEHLDNHSLGDIQDWANNDEDITNQCRVILTQVSDLPESFKKGFYAAHVVAAAVIEALSKGSDISLVFDRMLGILKIMHDSNPSWGPLFVRHPGDLFAERSYIPHEED